MNQADYSALISENAKLKQELQQSQFERDRYKKLFDASADAFFTIDLSTGKFTDCNNSAVEMYGVASRHDFLNLEPAVLSPEVQPCGTNSLELANEYIGKTISDGFHVFQWSHKKIDDTPFECLISLTAIHLDQSPLILAVCRNISSIVETQTKLELALKNANNYQQAYLHEKQKFETFVNLAPIGIAINKLSDGSFTYINKEFSNFTGYSVEELNSMDYWQLTPKEYEQQEYEQLNDIAKHGTYGPYQKEYIHKEGHNYPVLLSGLKITETNGEDFIWSVVQDISQQKAIETQIQSAREQADSVAFRMQLANDSAGIGVWEWDIVTNALVWDDWMYKLYGVTRDQFSGAYEAWENQLHPEDIEYAQSSLEHAVSVRGTYDPEFRIIRSDGKVRTIKACGEVIVDKDGTPIKVIGVNYDVSDKVEAIETLKLAKRQAEKASSAKGDFLANMSHEIRTPMNAILGGLELLQSAKLDNDLKSILDNASFSAKSLLTVINDILDYSKIESNNLQLEYAPFSLIDVIDSVKYDLDSLISNKAIEFSVQLDENFVDGWLGDLVRVKQILLNLSSNAVKFTERGSVKLVIGYVSLNGAKTVSIDVIDTGIGMSAEAQRRIFERFSQADTSTTRKYGGTGLGMSITVNLVKMMGGDIQLTSELGKGTSVKVLLPLKPAELKPNQEIVQSLSAPNMSNKKILIAEDNKINQVLIKSMLKETSAKLIVVENGADALQISEQEKFDLVLMDIHMPVMDGTEAQKKINDIHKDLPIIALTANVMAEDVKSYLEQGFVAHVAKPISMNTLYGVLSRFNY